MSKASLILHLSWRVVSTSQLVGDLFETGTLQ